MRMFVRVGVYEYVCILLIDKIDWNLYYKIQIRNWDTYFIVSIPKFSSSKHTTHASQEEKNCTQL